MTFFTSEPYSKTKYISKQLVDQLVCTFCSKDEAERGIIYFGVRPSFVSQRMKGTFQKATIIMTGCGGLVNPSMASAFVEKGAKVYIGWNEAIFF